MGTYASSYIYVTVPADRITGLAQELRKKFVERDNGGWGNYFTGYTDQQLVGQFLPLTEGNESMLQDEETYTMEEDGTLVISGAFYGKVSYDNEEVEGVYAENGAHGVIDSMCEDEPLRTRLTRDGMVVQTSGRIIYPGDVEEAL